MVDHARSEKVGDLGEHVFSGLCLRAGLTPTKTGKDKFGWDFLVEFPISRLPLLNIDAQPSAPKILCQVKATDKTTPNDIVMTVSNWEKLATSVLPSFVYILTFEGEDEPVSSYLCHFDNERIGKTLKRIRELESRGETELHHHEMSFNVKDGEKIDLTGLALKKAISSSIGPDIAAYMKKKSDFLRTIGYEQGNSLLKFSCEMTISDFADALIGMGEIKVTGGTISSLRFGLPLEQKAFTGGTIKLEHTNSPSCKVSVTSKKSRLKSSLVANVFSTPDLIPKDSVKTRVSSGSILDILISQEVTDFRFKIEPRIPYRLSEILSTLEFVLACEQGAVVEFEASGKSFGKMSIDRDVVLNADFRQLLKRARWFRKYLDMSGVRDDVTVELEHLFEPSENIQWMKMAISESGRIKAEVEQKDFYWSGKGILATVINLHINGQNHIGLIYWESIFTIRKGKVTAKTKQPKVYGSFFVADNELGKLREEHQRFEAFCHEISHGTLMFREISDNLDTSANIPSLTPSHPKPNAE